MADQEAPTLLLPLQMNLWEGSGNQLKDFCTAGEHETDCMEVGYGIRITIHFVSSEVYSPQNSHLHHHTYTYDASYLEENPRPPTFLGVGGKGVE